MQQTLVITESGFGHHWKWFKCSKRSVTAVVISKYSNVIIDYVTIATLGNAVDFGDLHSIKSNGECCASSTRLVVSNGEQKSHSRQMDYVHEIMTTGNTVDFGDLDMLDTINAGGASNGHGGL